MTDFIDRYEAAELNFPHSGNVPRYLAAHGPKLMDFAARRLEGAYTYLQTLDYTGDAKHKLGEKRLHLMQPTVFSNDPGEARELARRAIAIYLTLENYHRAWRERGFADSDFADGGSDEFIDALIAWGDQDKIAQRYADQRDKGADHIIIIPVKADLRTEEGWSTVAALVNA